MMCWRNGVLVNWKNDDLFSEYVPTQIFTEYIRFMNNCHIDGIVYRSSLTGRKNIVLFYDNETSDQVLQLNHAFTI